eukprot:180128-Rhodomonas_salina.1
MEHCKCGAFFIAPLLRRGTNGNDFDIDAIALGLVWRAVAHVQNAAMVAADANEAAPGAKESVAAYQNCCRKGQHLRGMLDRPRRLPKRCRGVVERYSSNATST